MKIKNGIENTPTLTGAGQQGEFRIRNSAKAFGILSSGLYANKIRAIIREYSCNAVDSHIEAGKTDVPFDVHLPTALEPWFAVRDYGVGLDDQQVTNIFTTYFESTKSGTDDLIGGLGLGSKSAFSYTENFTITAIKNGVKRVYTAFINAEGVPSIALMGQDETQDPTGVEIRFAVDNNNDFWRFENEAKEVYRHFSLRPIVSGPTNFQFSDPQYEQKDIVPGIHLLGGREYSRAVMGNIAYPLQVPAEQTDDIFNLLNCGLEIHFDIGELDIQASREGLSYIPETVAAIRARLVELNDSLAGILEKELSQYKTVWELDPIVRKKASSKLWCEAVKLYVHNNYPDMFRVGYYDTGANPIEVSVDNLAKKYNIKINAFRIDHYYNSGPTACTIYVNQYWDGKASCYVDRFKFEVCEKTNFVVTDTKVGALARAKYHWKNSDDVGDGDRVYVLSPADKNKPMRTKAFFNLLKNPPKKQIFKASELMKQERKTVNKDATILSLQKRNRTYYDTALVWREASQLSAFNDSDTFYYLPLSGFTTQGKIKDIHRLAELLRDSKILTDTIYGVRKADLETIQSKKNWVNLDDYLEQRLASGNLFDTMEVVKGAINFDKVFKFGDLTSMLDAKSPYAEFFNLFANISQQTKEMVEAIEKLCALYDVTQNNNVEAEVTKYKNDFQALQQRYPLLSELSSWTKKEAVAEYINAIDTVKGV